jgi:hypothetical protein
MKFSERPGDSPDALRAWFYPGDSFGQEFVYPKVRAIQLAQTTKVIVPAAAVHTLDEWYPTKLTCQATSVVKSGAEFCYTGYQRFANGRFEETIDPPDPNKLFPDLRFQNVLGPSSMFLVRRSTSQST